MIRKKCHQVLLCRKHATPAVLVSWSLPPHPHPFLSSPPPNLTPIPSLVTLASPPANPAHPRSRSASRWSSFPGIRPPGAGLKWEASSFVPSRSVSGGPWVPSLLPTRRPHLGPSGPGLSSEVPRRPLLRSAKPGKLFRPVASSLDREEGEQSSVAASQGSKVGTGITVPPKSMVQPRVLVSRWPLGLCRAEPG